MNITTTARQHLIGATLRQHREKMGYTIEDAANVLECDRSKISRIETGQRGVRPKELRELLSEYDTGECEQAVLCALASPNRMSGWWEDYSNIVTGDELDMAVMESLAASVCTYHPQQVPALLQTEAYATAVISADPTAPEPSTRKRAVESILARQGAIFGADTDPRRTMIIGEGALHQRVGGTAVMRAQLDHLTGLCDSGTGVTIRVLPFASAHPGFDTGGLTLLSFGPDLGVVHLATMSGGIYLEGRDVVASYAAAFDRICEAALSVPESAAMLRCLAAGTGSAKAA